LTQSLPQILINWLQLNAFYIKHLNIHFHIFSLLLYDLYLTCFWRTTCTDTYAHLATKHERACLSWF